MGTSPRHPIVVHILHTCCAYSDTPLSAAIDSLPTGMSFHLYGHWSTSQCQRGGSDKNFLGLGD